MAAILVATVAALFTFPAAIPWMVAGWMAWYTAAAVRGRAGIVPLVGCALVLIVKGAAPSPGIMAMAAALCVAMVCAAVRARISPVAAARLTRVSIAAVWIGCGALAVDWQRSAHSSRAPTVDPRRPVVCLGDSLTAGMRRDAAYPDHLARRLSVPVLNSGREGITTSEGLKRLPAILARKPQVVVIELGGHDFLFGRSRADARANLSAMIGQCRHAGAEVLLMEIPRGFVTDGYRGLERELARQYDLELVSDSAIRKIVLMSPFAPPGMWLDRDRRLSDDGLHPNARGSRLLADEVAAALERIYGERIVRDR